jgi:hypothetical protein
LNWLNRMPIHFRFISQSVGIGTVVLALARHMQLVSCYGLL